MKTTKRVYSMILAVVLLFSALPLTTFAASAWPGITASHTCAMISPGQIPVYRNSSLTTRGTCSPARSYNSYIDKGDDLIFQEITANYIKVNFPTSQGRKVGYIKTSTILGVSAPSQVVTSRAKVTTYQDASASRTYGYVAVNDTVYKCGTTKSGYVLVIYNVSGGYKAGFVTKSDWERVQGTSTDTGTNTSSGWQMPMANAYCTWRSSGNWSWATYTSNSSGRNYHLGIDIYGTNGTVYAAANGKVVAASSSNNGANGRYIIIEHTLSGKTVYSFYAHLSSVNVSVGQSVNKGNKIGVAGGSGYGKNNNYGTHLHFAIVDTLWTSGGYYGYATYFTGNKVNYKNVTYFNPIYVINNGRLP